MNFFFTFLDFGILNELSNRWFVDFLFSQKSNFWNQVWWPEMSKNCQQFLLKIKNQQRDHPFKTSANLRGFWPLPPLVGNLLHSNKMPNPLKKRKECRHLANFALPPPIIYRNSEINKILIYISEISNFRNCRLHSV